MMQLNWPFKLSLTEFKGELVHFSSKEEGNRTITITYWNLNLYLCHNGNDSLLPSQFVFFWVHVTEEEKTGDISFKDRRAL